jgi:hypothetical protein
MIMDIFKTRCPYCGVNMYPEYIREIRSRKCEKCESEIVINLKSTYFARLFFFSCLFIFGPLLGYIFDRATWTIVAAIIVGLIGYAKFTIYSKDAKFTDL